MRSIRKLYPFDLPSRLFSERLDLAHLNGKHELIFLPREQEHRSLGFDGRYRFGGIPLLSKQGGYDQERFEIGHDQWHERSDGKESVFKDHAVDLKMGGVRMRSQRVIGLTSSGLRPATSIETAPPIDCPNTIFLVSRRTGCDLT